MSDARERVTLSPQAYRWTDRMTKLAGVALVAVGLEVGGTTLPGLLLGATGAALAVCTVFVERATESGEITDE